MTAQSLAISTLISPLLLGAASVFAAEHPPLVSAEAARCVLCHDDLLEEGSSTHQPASEGCATCHEVSVAATGTTISLMEDEPELCLLCHDQLAAAVELEFESPHFAAADSCLTCHDPHAGAAEPVLAATVGELCALCHDAADLQEQHGGQLTAATDCTTCHSPHGSNNPSMLAASRLHAPFESGGCEGCHRPPFGGRLRLRTRGERLCEACHGDVTEAAGERRSVHAALQGEAGRAGCLSCHDPHMSEARALLAGTGPDLCSGCHAETVEASGAETGHPPAADDCLSCHRPHASSEPSLLAEPRDQLCASCHDLEPAPAAPAPAAFELVGSGSASYGPAPVVAAEEFDNGTGAPALCTSPFPAGTWSGEIVVCERGEVKRVLKSANVRAGGAGGLVLVNRPAGAADLFADPHAVPAVHLRAAAAATLETWLAAPGEHQGRIEAGRLLLTATTAPRPAAGDLASAHLGADLSRLDCMSCHSPHGAGHPGLLAEHLHAPLEDGCDTCHEERFDELMEGGGTELCVLCHEDVAEDAAAASVSHSALEVGSCTECHNPHASAQEKLVKAPGAGPCADCHDEQMPGEGEVAHGVIDLVGCRACHEPHGGENEKLLRQRGPDLCLACHDAGVVRAEEGAARVALAGRFEVTAAAARSIRPVRLSPDRQHDHPVAGHRTLGTPTEVEIRGANVETTFHGELTCLTCHDPHKGRSRQLFRWDAASSAEACRACHLK